MEHPASVAASEDENEVPPMLRCPCHEFLSIESILAVIVHPESSMMAVGDKNNIRFQRFMDWLQGPHTERAREEQKMLHCFDGSSYYCCTYRVSVSFRILNDIRKIVQPYVQPQQRGEKEHLSSLSPSNRKDEDVYKRLSNDDFPSLPSVAIKKFEEFSHNNHTKGTLTTASTAVVKRQKRRIRPVVVTQQETVTMNLLNLPPTADEQSLMISQAVTNNDSLKRSTNVWNRKMTSTPQKNSAGHAEIVTAWLDTPGLMETPSNKDRGKVAASVGFTDNVQSTLTKTRQIKDNSADELANSSLLHSLIDIYTALIDHCLVPSTLMEIHWLLRLLVISSDQQNPLPNIAVSDHFSSILSNPDRCRYFAIVSLRNQSIVLQGLGIRTLRKLIRCPPFCQYLPDITEHLIRHIQKYDLENISIHSIIGNRLVDQTVHLTLPFKPERDSRHNFRSREMQAIYKNREECRDMFLFQLRTYLQMKGKMVDSSETTRVLTKLRHSSSVIINDLFVSNIPWFAEVFIEMILQIGHIPLQETDTELTRTIDNAKLQKLHQRFTSRTSLSTNCNIAHCKTIDPKRDITTPPIVAAQQHFTGHQEFFFLFIMYADSYKFSIHLRTQLITKLKKLTDSTKQTEPTEMGILDARLLARFLGAVVFSPTWRSLHEEVVKAPEFDEVTQIDAAGLSIYKSLCNGVKHGKLLFTVLWIVELLKMGKWNLALFDSHLYNQTVGGLRLIQIRLVKEGISFPSHCQEFTLVRNSLESFFYESVGLAQVEKIERRCTDSVDFLKQALLTNPSKAITSGIAVVLAPQLDDLSMLVMQLSQGDSSTFRNSGVTKKLRPSVVCPSINLLQSPMLSTTTKFSPSDDSVEFFTSLLPSGKTTQLSDAFLSTLRGNFFHQHGELKLVCDFVAVNILKNLRPQIIRQCIEPLIPVETPDRDQITIIRSDMTKSSMYFLSSKLEEKIRVAINALAPAGLPSAVLEMGINLIVTTLIESGEAMVTALVDTETKRLHQPIRGIQGKRLFSKEISTGLVEQIDHYKALSEIINELSQKIHTLAENENTSNVEASLISVRLLLNIKTGSDSTIIPPENSLRQLYISILELDDQSHIVAKWAMKESQCSVEYRWKVLAAYIDIAIKLRTISHRGLHKLIIRFSDELFLVRAIQLGVRAQSSTGLFEILCQLVEAKLILSSSLNDAILKSGITEALITDGLSAVEKLSSRT